MSNPGLTKTYVASGAIGAYRFVKFGSTDLLASIAAASTDDVIGVTGQVGAASGEDVDVILDGIVEVIAGGTITRGQLVMSNASGAAVAHTGDETSIEQFVLAGGSAGDLTATGILTTDALVSVVVLDRDATAANINLVDLTSEFTISAADTINNTDGTATTGNTLLVTVQRSGAGNTVCGRAMQSAVSGDRFRVKR